ncbi:MAG: TolC family protein [Planctomycetales bacterium]|nr:TolC family protein [Planctomycetales bacterium]
MRAFFNSRRFKWLTIPLVFSAGCTQLKNFSFQKSWEESPSYFSTVSTRIEYPNVRSNLVPEVMSAPAPLALDNPSEIPARELQLNEAIRMALTHGEILRSIGGSVVQGAAASRSRFDPAITESNSTTGVEAALSAFDAQVAGQLFWQKNNQPNNTTFLVFQPQAFEQDATTFSYELAKRTATGASFAARHSVLYNSNNSPARFFPSDFTGWFEAEYRQPLLRGAGVDFNRIAGPGNGIGQYNGVLIARINTDVALADFEQGIVSFVNDVETAYWELFFAYHNLEAQVAGRNSALRTWQRIKELQRVGMKGSDAAAVAQARSQYYSFDSQVKDALAGANGLYAKEQQLRYLIGLPASDGTLLKPISDPMDGEVIVDWNSALADAVTKRVEVRRQKWNIKRRELELVAAKLNRRPTFDFLGKYRYRGLGDNLIGDRDPNNSFDNLYQNIFEGDYQEWQAGVELSYPVGLRRASAAIANARWNLCKEQAILKEQELRISHDLATSSRQIQRSFELMKSNYNRQASDLDQVQALQLRYEEGLDNISFLLQAQQQLATSQSAYFRSLVDYQLALRDFHREKGSLLNYNQIGLSEGAWPAPAYQDAQERGRFFAPRDPDLVEARGKVSNGSFDPSQVGGGTTYPMEQVAVPQ